LQAAAGWQDAQGSMSGAVSFANRSGSACALQGRPGIHLLDAQGALMPVANVDMDPAFGNPDVTPAARSLLVVLRPGERAFVRFVWSNWCGAYNGPFNLAVALPGEAGQLTVAALDPQGKPITSAPKCDAPDVASTINIGVFEQEPR
jgi:hypothetical protein